MKWSIKERNKIGATLPKFCSQHEPLSSSLLEGVGGPVFILGPHPPWSLAVEEPGFEHSPLAFWTMTPDKLSRMQSPGTGKQKGET